MAMEITNNYGKYYNSAVYNAAENEQTEKTKTEKAQSGGDKVQEYYEKLCRKFPQITFNTSGGEMRCSSNKVVVNLSYDCLKKMANDPEFAKETEWNLSGEVAANAKVYSFAKGYGTELGGRIVKYDANGNRTSACGGMRTANVGNHSIQRTQDNGLSVEERMKAKRKETEEMKARMDEKRREKAKLEERLEKRRLEREACLEHFAEGNSGIKRYKSSDMAQPISFFDTNA